MAMTVGPKRDPSVILRTGIGEDNPLSKYPKLARPYIGRLVYSLTAFDGAGADGLR